MGKKKKKVKRKKLIRQVVYMLCLPLHSKLANQHFLFVHIVIVAFFLLSILERFLLTLWSFTFIWFFERKVCLLDRKSQNEMRVALLRHGIYVSVISFSDCNNFMVKYKSVTLQWTALPIGIHTILKIESDHWVEYKTVYNHSCTGQFIKIGISRSINFSFINTK